MARGSCQTLDVKGLYLDCAKCMIAGISDPMYISRRFLADIFYDEPCGLR